MLIVVTKKTISLTHDTSVLSTILGRLIVQMMNCSNALQNLIGQWLQR